MLVLVGAMMMGESIHIDWSTMISAVPAFLTIVIQPFTFSIANGIYAGLVMTVLLYILTGSFLECFTGVSDKQEDDLADMETALLPDLNGQDHPQEADVARLPPLAHPVGAEPIGVHAGARSHARSITGSLPVGSLGKVGRGTPYERGSFTMYINTLGSQTGSHTGAGLLGSHGHPSEEPEEH